MSSSDGTAAGTVKISSVVPYQDFTASGGTVYFGAAGAGGTLELWKTDGTDAGTARVEDANPGIANFSPAYMTAVNGGIIFSATDSPSDQNPYELWRSDGTAAGTQLLKDIYPGPLGSYPDWFTPAAGKVYFSATDAAGASATISNPGGTASAVSSTSPGTYATAIATARTAQSDTASARRSASGSA